MVWLYYRSLNNFKHRKIYIRKLNSVKPPTTFKGQAVRLLWMPAVLLWKQFNYLNHIFIE